VKINKFNYPTLLWSMMRHLNKLKLVTPIYMNEIQPFHKLYSCSEVL